MLPSRRVHAYAWRTHIVPRVSIHCQIYEFSFRFK